MIVATPEVVVVFVIGPAVVMRCAIVRRGRRARSSAVRHTGVMAHGLKAGWDRARGMLSDGSVDGANRDQHLFERLASGDTTALEPIYDAHSPVVFGLLVRIVADRPIAEDLLQDVFVRAWQHTGTYQTTRGRLRSWLLGIAHHLALNELRRQQRRPRPALPPAGTDPGEALQARLDPGPAPDEVAWVAVRRQELVEAMEQLSPPQRTVLDLYATGFSQSEIAARLGEPLGTVKTRMRRGVPQLRDILQAHGFEHE